MKNKKTIDFIMLFLKGILMGIANKIPGVSGGMVALLTGFYQELMHSYRRINHKAFALLFTGRWRSFAQYVNLKFLLAINLGSLFSFFSASLLLDYLISKKEILVWAFFFGLIIGSVFYISKRIKKWDFKTILILILGSIIGLGISFLEPQLENDNLVFVFFCGMISVSGMTLPGLSGSFILMILGNYNLLLVDSVTVVFRVITQLLSGDFSFYKDAYLCRMISVAIVFGLGSLSGLISLSYLLSYFLKKYYEKVIALLIGFIIGSLGTVWPWKIIEYQKNNLGEFILDNNSRKIAIAYQRYMPQEITYLNLGVLFFIMLGFGILVYIDKQEKKHKNE